MRASPSRYPVTRCGSSVSAARVTIPGNAANSFRRSASSGWTSTPRSTPSARTAAGPRAARRATAPGEGRHQLGAAAVPPAEHPVLVATERRGAEPPRPVLLVGIAAPREIVERLLDQLLPVQARLGEDHIEADAALAQVLVLLGALRLHADRTAAPDPFLLRQIRELAPVPRQDPVRQLDQVRSVIPAFGNRRRPPHRL